MAKQTSGFLSSWAKIRQRCTNACQPSLETLMQIAKLLNVQVDDLLRFDELPEIEKTLLRKNILQ